MEEHTRKHTPLTRKIRRIFDRHKGIQPHKLYPKEYYHAYWFNETDYIGIKAVSKIEKVSKKAAAHLIFTYGFKRYMGLKWKEELDAMETPEGQAAQAKRTRFILELRRLCRERGWNVNKLLWRHRNLAGSPSNFIAIYLRPGRCSESLSVFVHFHGFSILHIRPYAACPFLSGDIEHVRG